LAQVRLRSQGMPWLAYSSAAVLVSPMTPCFVETYPASPPTASRPAVDDTFTMVPPPARRPRCRDACRRGHRPRRQPVAQLIDLGRREKERGDVAVRSGRRRRIVAQSRPNSKDRRARGDCCGGGARLRRGARPREAGRPVPAPAARSGRGLHVGSIRRRGGARRSRAAAPAPGVRPRPASTSAYEREHHGEAPSRDVCGLRIAGSTRLSRTRFAPRSPR
jgi:hypothetical protein